jgi:hypothetical protein
MSMTASNPAEAGGADCVLSEGRDAVWRPAQPAIAGNVKPATPPSINLREIIQISVVEAMPKRKSYCLTSRAFASHVAGTGCRPARAAQQRRNSLALP